MGAPRTKVLTPGVTRWARRTLILLLLTLAGTALAPTGIRGLGHWLVVSDPLQPARAIVVFGGELPTRAIEAASIYQQGWAPEIWIAREWISPTQESALRRLGVHVTREEAYVQEVLQRIGVPSGAIRFLSDSAANTMEEVELVARQLRLEGGDRIILVTSKPHTRRVRAIWRALVGNNPQAIVRYASADAYDPDRWWYATSDAMAVSREVLGLVNVWAGFPLHPRRQ